MPNTLTPSDYRTLPKDIIRELEWRKGQRVVVTKKGKTITIQDYEG